MAQGDFAGMGNGVSKRRWQMKTKRKSFCGFKI